MREIGAFACLVSSLLAPASARGEPPAYSNEYAEAFGGVAPGVPRDERPFELALFGLAGTTAVGHSEFHASGVSGARLQALGSDLGYTQPLVGGFGAYGLYYASRDFALGISAAGALGSGGSSDSSIAAAVMPGAITALWFGPAASVVLLHGATSLRADATFGFRGVSIDLHAAEFLHAGGRPGQASAADFFVSPRLVLLRRFEHVGLVGAFAGIEQIVTSSPALPAFDAGLVLGIR